MKKIINGRMYNTETAKEIADISFGCYGDFHRFEETLYLKKTGEFFLYGEGGPASRYAECCDDGTQCGGEGFIPLKEWEAKMWVEDNCDVETYIELFGEPEE